MAKEDMPKKRHATIYGTTKGKVSSIGISVNSLTGELRFDDEMIDVYSQTTYHRPKSPKVTSRIPQPQSGIFFDTGPALRKNFDTLIAVDTNTRSLDGCELSITGILVNQKVWVGGEKGLENYWQYFVPFCLEFVNLRGNRENVGWAVAVERLKDDEHIRPSTRVGLIVDSDLGRLNDYNARRLPLLGTRFLDENVTLIYASSDGSKKSIVNRLISQADRVSRQCLDMIVSGAAPFNHERVQSEWYDGFRFITPASPKSSNEGSAEKGR